MPKRKIERAIAERSILTWAYKYRKIRTGGDWKPYNIGDYPFLKGIFHALQDPETDRVVLQKGTQIGATEAAITSALYFLDVKAENVLYMLPNQGQLGDFAHSRLDKTIEKSPYLDRLFNDISNVGLKVSSRGSFYLRGANSSQQLEEFPAGFVIRDELSRMDQSNANLALKRLGSSENSWVLDLGHPTYEGDAISSEFADSSRYEWVYTCPSCGKTRQVSFFENYYERDKSFGCSCGQDWTKEDVVNDGKWSAQGDENNPVQGFHISRILSPVSDLEDIAREYEKAKAEGEYKIAQFHQTVLGQPFSSEGDKLSLDDVKNARTGQPRGTSDARNTIMGVDTGKPLYWSVIKGNEVLDVGRATKFDQLHSIREKYDVSTVLFDAQPEPHAVESFINDLPSDCRGWMVRTQGTGDIGPPTVKKDDNEVKAHAVWMFDHLFDKFNKNEIVLPSDFPAEAAEHLTNPVRLIDEDPRGNPVPKYEKGECHFADSLKFAFVGLEISDQVPSVSQEKVFDGFDTEAVILPEGKTRAYRYYLAGVNIARDSGAYLLAGDPIEKDKNYLEILKEWIQPSDQSFPPYRHIRNLEEFLREAYTDLESSDHFREETETLLHPRFIFTNHKPFVELIYELNEVPKFNTFHRDLNLNSTIPRVQTLLKRDKIKISPDCEQLTRELENSKWEDIESSQLIGALVSLSRGIYQRKFRRV